jgi:hypothetical protein
MGNRVVKIETEPTSVVLQPLLKFVVRHVSSNVAGCSEDHILEDRLRLGGKARHGRSTAGADVAEEGRWREEESVM